MLIEEPPVTTEKLLDHLKLAEKYQLENLMSMTLASAEGMFGRSHYGSRVVLF